MSKRDFPLTNKERRDSQVYNISHIASKYILWINYNAYIEKVKEFHEEQERKNVRSPLATHNYFSQFDKVVEQRLAQVANDAVIEGSVNKERSHSKGILQNLNSNLGLNVSRGDRNNMQSSLSSTSKQYSRRGLVLKRDKNRSNFK